MEMHGNAWKCMEMHGYESGAVGKKIVPMAHNADRKHYVIKIHTNFISLFTIRF